ncbi:MAG: threonylcarbamoyl-AMP synthase [Lachnospiraceae bacterium]|nr:threonylcarbamoyl-AMP synthase [Lachnospiraceae bacterium]
MRKIDPRDPDFDHIRAAADVLKAGGLVAFPTETVYGLGADALRSEAARKIYAAKGRPSDNPLIIHIADFDALYRIAREIPPQTRLLADAFWPGPLTMIFRKSEIVPYETTGGLDTVAVRMPDHPAALALIRESGGYIAAPSANTSGRPSPTLAEHVAEDLAGKIPLILDGGTVGIGIESTIIDLSCITQTADGAWVADETPLVLRPGYITREMLAEVIGAVGDDPGLAGDTDRELTGAVGNSPGLTGDTDKGTAGAADNGPAGAADPELREIVGFDPAGAAAYPKAPGMKYRHYAPKAEMLIVSGAGEAVIRRINTMAAENRRRGIKTGVICTEETERRYQAEFVRSIGSRADEDSIARHLFAVLREMDALGADRIYSESFSSLRIGTAVMNRLMKAAGHHVLHV